MKPAAFTPVPFSTPPRAQPYVPLCAAASPTPPPSTTAQQVHSHLRALCADQALPTPTALTPPALPLPPTWPHLLHALSANAVIGSTLVLLSSRLGLHTLLSLSPPQVSGLLRVLRQHLQLTFPQRRRVITNLPQLLSRNPDTLAFVIAELRQLGLTLSHLRAIVLRLPAVLEITPLQVRRVAIFLTSPPIAFPPDSLSTLLLRAPWLLVYDIETHLVPRATWLSEHVPPTPLHSLIYPNPRLLSVSVHAFTTVLTFMRHSLRLTLPQTQTTLRKYPHLLTLPVDSLLKPTANTLRREVPLTARDLARIARSFPAVLTLDVDANIRPVLHFLRHIGVRNVSRIVKRLPPILGYDVDTNLSPKLSFLIDELGVPLVEILLFPGVFSYSLEQRIRPRATFTVLCGLVISEVGLNCVVSPSDHDFCERIVRTSVKTYHEFVKQRSQDGEQPEDRVWGKKPFKVSLIRIPWNELPQTSRGPNQKPRNASGQPDETSGNVISSDDTSFLVQEK